jgi:stage II sporulation protein AA (anti-sigma F factor antagonist)
MEIDIAIRKSVLTAKLSGELDHHNAEDVRLAVDNAFERSNCKHILFDFSDVTFMDSSGIGVIIGRYKAAEKRGGQTGVAGMNNAMQRIFNISGLAKIVKNFNKPTEAEKILSGGAVRG